MRLLSASLLLPTCIDSSSVKPMWTATTMCWLAETPSMMETSCVVTRTRPHTENAWMMVVLHTSSKISRHLP